MFQQHTVDASSSNDPPVVVTNTGAVLDWIDAWPVVRSEIDDLLGAYAQADGGHDTTSFQPMIEQLDASMRLLRHRVSWLRSYLAHEDALLLDRHR
jgi:hypothetical protein